MAILMKVMKTLLVLLLLAFSLSCDRGEADSETKQVKGIRDGQVGHQQSNIQKKVPLAVNGVLDLRDWNFEKDGLVNLNGEWEFYWKQLFKPEDFKTDQESKMTGSFNVPDLWNHYEFQGKNPFKSGYATFRLKVYLDDRTDSLTVSTHQIKNAHVMFINGEKVGSAGKVTTDPETTESQWKAYASTFELEKNPIEIILQVCSWDGIGGITKRIKIGKKEDILPFMEMHFAYEILVSGGILLFFIYFFCYFLLRRSDISLLVTTVFILFYLFGNMLNDDFLIVFAKGLPFDLFLRLRSFLVVSLTLLFILLYRISFSDNTKVLKAYIIITAVQALIPLVVPPGISGSPLLFMCNGIIQSVIILHILLKLITHVKNKTEGSAIFLIGCIAYAFACFGGVSYMLDRMEFCLFGIGLWIVILCQALTHAAKFTKTFDKVEILAAQLEKSSKKLKQNNTRLLELDKLKDEFLSSTSHELRTPLNGIIGIAESLYDGAAGAVSKQMKSNLAMIVSSGKRLSNLVNDILDFSKLKNQVIELQLKSVSIKTLTDVVLQLSRPLLARKQIELKKAIPIDDGILPVKADENRLQQILLNLVGNAIKFTESGEVRVSASVENQMVNITVSDTGIGIPEDRFDLIFQSFEQVDSSIAREFAGTGLGLSISKQLIELHGGKIWVQSTVGEGSKFTFSIPVSTETVTAEETSQTIQSLEIDDTKETAVQMPVEIKRNGEFHVLIVDDDPINLQVLENHLSLQKYSVTQAINGEQALRAVQEKKPDLVLLDIMMPVMSGYEVCLKLRETYPATELPIIMLTAKNQVTDLIDGFNSGANDYIPKPFSKNELLTRVKAHLQLSQTNRAYTRFVPQEFLKLLKRDSIVEVKLGENVQMDMSILFADIRSFTSISEKMTPQENFAFLNSYLEKMAPVVNRHKGFIDKYLGDGLMALFSTNADDAVLCGIEMLETLIEYNEERQKSGYDPIRIGVGINTGNMMIGTIGDSDRMDGSVVSDSVNLASRLESLTKEYGAPLIISQQTYEHLADPSKYALRTLAYVQPKGKSETVKIFEVCDADPEEIRQKKLLTLEPFEKAVGFFYDHNKQEAEKLFQECLMKNPQDRATQIYLVRCQGIAKFG